MARLLFLCFLGLMLACETTSIDQNQPIATVFQKTRHDASLDPKMQPLLKQYLAVINNIQEQDSVNLQMHGEKLIQIVDSLSNQKLSHDTLTQRNALQGLLNIQAEMTAILLEVNNSERLFGANMLSLHFIDLLASIGYQMQSIYLFSDAEGRNWIGSNKKSTNPFQQNDQTLYEATQILNELK